MSETTNLRELVEDTGSWEKLHKLASAELDALLAENEQLKNHAVPFAVLTNENELLTADNALLRKQLDEAIEVIEAIDNLHPDFPLITAFLERMKK